MDEHAYVPQLPRFQEMTKALTTLVTTAAHEKYGYGRTQLHQDLMDAVDNTRTFIEQMEHCIEVCGNVVKNTQAGLCLTEEAAEKIRQQARDNLTLYHADLEAAQLLVQLVQDQIPTPPP